MAKFAQGFGHPQVGVAMVSRAFLCCCWATSRTRFTKVSMVPRPHSEGCPRPTPARPRGSTAAWPLLPKPLLAVRSSPSPMPRVSNGRGLRGKRLSRGRALGQNEGWDHGLGARVHIRLIWLWPPAVGQTPTRLRPTSALEWVAQLPQGSGLSQCQGHHGVKGLPVQLLAHN